jgi:hypothetical protein
MRSQRKKTKQMRYFFYKGDLCKKQHISRANDIITAWNYPKGRMEKYVYSDVRRNGEQAYSTKDVMNLLNRKDNEFITNAIRDGNINAPSMTYGIDENRNTHSFYWREEEIVDFHEYLKTVHRGRPRKDGGINTGNLPTTAELRAKMRSGTVFYVKVGDEFVPTWQAEKF